MMEALSLASKYVCPVCGFLPEYPYAAEDGFFYHEICIEDIFDRACDGAITSPATKRPMGKKLVFAKTIQSFIEKLAKNEEVNRKYVRREAEDATKMVGKIEERAQVGSARDMALLGRWHLFCEQDGLECKGDVDGLAYGYHLCKNAADKDGVDGMACQGMCLIHGHGVGQNWSEGFELLIDAANEGSGMTVVGTSGYFSPWCPAQHCQLSLRSIQTRQLLLCRSSWVQGGP